jgi:hypothetical protein
MASLKYAEFDDAEMKLHSLCRGLRAHDPASLPGAVERADHNARMTFHLDGRWEIRYFRNQAEAYRVKANYRGIWRPCRLHYWNHKDQMWIG